MSIHKYQKNETQQWGQSSQVSDSPMNPSPLLPRSLDKYQICNINAKICTFIFWIRIFWAYNMENPGKGVKLFTVGPTIKIQKFNYNVSLVIWGILKFYFNSGLYHKCINCFLEKKKKKSRLTTSYVYLFSHFSSNGQSTVERTWIDLKFVDSLFN